MAQNKLAEVTPSLLDGGLLPEEVLCAQSAWSVFSPRSPRHCAPPPTLPLTALKSHAIVRGCSRQRCGRGELPQQDGGRDKVKHEQDQHQIRNA